MKNSIQIAASLMCCNPLTLGNEIRDLEESGCDQFHVDIMDGSFVKNFAMSIRDIQFIRTITDLPIDAHLMIHNPTQYIADLIAAGTNRIIIHPESCQNYLAALEKIRLLGANAGLALSPDAAIECLNEQSLSSIDTVLIMAVTPGFAGQPFRSETIFRVSEVHELLCSHDAKEILIAVDGAISIHTVPPLYQAGAQKFVGGSSGLFLNGVSYSQAIQNLKDSILYRSCFENREFDKLGAENLGQAKLSDGNGLKCLNAEGRQKPIFESRSVYN